MTHPIIFISYSHKDEAWKDRLVTQLRVLELEGVFHVWEDRQIATGDEWKPEIEKSMEAASLGIPALAVSLEAHSKYHLSYSDEVNFSVAAYFWVRCSDKYRSK